MSTAVKIENVGKRYRIGRSDAAYGRLTESLANAARAGLRGGRTAKASDPHIWALRNVSLDVEEGEVLGVIGRNGAGKTTLLKILTGITEPTEGAVGINGRVGSLLEVGTGFHPELTGRENILLNGAILGMRRREIARKFDDIVQFAEIGSFVDTPVKRYSSGMYVRLAFSVAAHLEPDVLLVDEVLSVGDQEFQRRCLGRVREISRGGRTVLFVSHNLAAVSALCTRACLLERGSLTAIGDVDEVLERYTRSMHQLTSTSLRERNDRRGSGDIRFTAVTVEGPSGPIHVGDPTTFTLSYAASIPRDGVEFAIGVFGPLGESLFHCQSRSSGTAFTLPEGDGAAVCSLPELPLLPGTYSINVFASAGSEVLDWVSDAATFEVFESDYFGGGHLPAPAHGRVVVRQAWGLGNDTRHGASSALRSKASA